MGCDSAEAGSRIAPHKGTGTAPRRSPQNDIRAQGLVPGTYSNVLIFLHLKSQMYIITR
jgi:hypothetical protein